MGEDKFSQARALRDDSAVMTVSGAIGKSFILGGILVVVAGMIYSMAMQGLIPAGLLWPSMIGSLVIGLILAIAIVIKNTWAPFLSPVYAAVEGVLVGAISAAFAMQFEGIVAQAIMITLGIFFAMLAAYSTGLIKVTNTFRMIVVSATFGIMLVYAATWVLRMFAIQMPFIHDTGLIGIGISVFIVIIAALNLALDFDFFEKGAEAAAPKYMEWYAAFGLLVTLIWLYIEVLRLLAKLKSD